jgi:hypothetical protein
MFHMPNVILLMTTNEKPADMIQTCQPQMKTA